MSAHLPDASGKKPRTQNHIFVSYSHQDRVFVEKLADDLRKRGHVVWIDFDGIPGGTLWRQSIADGLHASASVLLVISPDAVASKWVEEEIRTAKNAGKRIIPILLREVKNTSPPTLQWVINEVQYINFFALGYQIGLERLLQDLPESETGIAGHCQKLIAELAALPWGLDNYIQEHAKILPMNASPYEDGVVRRERFNLLDHLWNSQRVIVLGEPGIGKTVALERFAWELARSEKPALPITVRLLMYDGGSFLEWIRRDLIRFSEIELETIEDTRGFLKKKRPSEDEVEFVFLLDGLNEVQPDHRESALSEIAKLSAEFPSHRIIVSSRVQDESWQRLRQGSTLKESVVVQPIDEEQIQTYLAAHLDDIDGEQLWRQLLLDDRMRELVTTPLLLWLLKEAWKEARDEKPAVEIRMPENRGELYRSFVERMLRRDDERQLNLSVRKARRISALSAIALDMHRRQSLTINYDDALKFVDDEKTLKALRVSGLLRGEDELRFAPHQTVQEHFAASGLLAGEQTGFPDYLKKQGVNVASSWWAETLIQLAGLTTDPNRLARWVAEANPWLAWWCVVEGRKVDAKTQRFIADQSIGLINSPNAEDRRRAALALSRVDQSKRVIPPLTQLSVDSDEAVSSNAYAALVKHGEDGERAFAKAFFQLPIEHRAAVGRNIAELDRRQGVALGADGLPDIDWVVIPQGEFIYGSSKSEETRSDDLETANHILHLDTFAMARYPITNHQFQAFIADRSGATRECWYRGLAANTENIRIAEQTHRYGNHPRVKVNWYNAIAFCRWLTWRLATANQQRYEAMSLPIDGNLPTVDDVDWANPMTWWVRLPTEQEWEKAARGVDGRTYPYGNKFSASKGNTASTKLGMPSMVGIFVKATSPYGIADMSGNVWEWCLTEYSETGRVDISNNLPRVARGGSWRTSSEYTGAAIRFSLYLPHNYYDDWGFRVATSHPAILDKLTSKP